MNTPLFLSLLFVHVLSFVVAFGAVIVIDTFGFLFLIKKFGVTMKLTTNVANITQRLIWLGFFGLVASGVPMLMMKGSVDELTKLKLFFVLMLGINGVYLHLIKKTLEKMGDIEELPAQIAFRVGLASFVSQLGWWGAFVIGFLHRHWQHEIGWPENGLLAALFIGILIAMIGFLGEIIFSKKNEKILKPTHR